MTAVTLDRTARAAPAVDPGYETRRHAAWEAHLARRETTSFLLFFVAVITLIPAWYVVDLYFETPRSTIFGIMRGIEGAFGAVALRYVRRIPSHAMRRALAMVISSAMGCIFAYMLAHVEHYDLYVFGYTIGVFGVSQLVLLPPTYMAVTMLATTGWVWVMHAIYLGSDRIADPLRAFAYMGTSAAVGVAIGIVRYRNERALFQANFDAEERNVALAKALAELRDAQARMVESEKLSALGRLLAQQPRRRRIAEAVGPRRGAPLGAASATARQHARFGAEAEDVDERRRRLSVNAPRPRRTQERASMRMPPTRAFLAVVGLLALAAVGCGARTPLEQPEPRTDAGEMDAGTAEPRDDAGARDAGPDAGRDTSLLDAGSDGGHDAGRRDAGFDSGTRDAGFDSGARDAGFDAGRRDAGLDAGRRDAGLDSGARDAGPDATVVTFPEAGLPDSGRPDAGAPDAGPPVACRRDADCAGTVCRRSPFAVAVDLGDAPLFCGTPTAGAAGVRAECGPLLPCDRGLCVVAGTCVMPCATDLDCPSSQRCVPTLVQSSPTALEHVSACIDRLDVPSDVTSARRDVPGGFRMDTLDETVVTTTMGASTHLVFESGTSAQFSLVTLRQAGLGRVLYDIRLLTPTSAPPLNPVASQLSTANSIIIPSGSTDVYDPSGFAVGFAGSSSGPLSLTTLSRTGTGTRLDFDFFYLALPSDLMPTGDVQSPVVANAVAALTMRYAAAGIVVGRVRTHVVVGATASRLTVLDEDASGNITGLDELFSLSAGVNRPSVPIFFIRSLPPSTLGVSGGIPGPHGVHGTAQSGVVISLDTIPASEVGYVMSHEVGHFLGLFHTSEADGLLLESLTDTPECRIGRDTNGDGILSTSECGAGSASNLMFWTFDLGAPGLFTAQQRVILQHAMVLGAP